MPPSHSFQNEDTNQTDTTKSQGHKPDSPRTVFRFNKNHVKAQ